MGTALIYINAHTNILVTIIKINIFINSFIYYMHMYFVYISECKYLAAIRVEFCGQPCTMWVPGTELRLLSLAASAFTL